MGAYTGISLAANLLRIHLLGVTNLQGYVAKEAKTTELVRTGENVFPGRDVSRLSLQTNDCQCYFLNKGRVDSQSLLTIPRDRRSRKCFHLIGNTFITFVNKINQ